MKGAAGCVLGMDCGTTNIKAILLDGEGRVLAEASRPSTFLSPGAHRQEQDPREWWDHAVDIFRDLRRQAGEETLAALGGICVSSHTVTLLPVDRQGTPLRNAITYQDSRCAGELEELVEKVGRQRFMEIVGGPPSAAFLPGKLLWFARHEPELFRRTHCFLQASSYINFRLTGAFTSDLDQAARTQCLDRETQTWSAEIGRALGMDLDALLPPPLAVDTVIGTVTPRAAAETGLPQGVPVLAGCCDAMAALYATGMRGLGDAGESSGTTSLLFVSSTRPSAPDAPVTTKPCAIPGVPWVFDAPIQSSGAALRWYIDTMAAQERREAEKAGVSIYDYLNQLALEAPAGCGGLLFFPYLMGERAPLWNDYARGMFIGLGMDTTRAQLIRAVFEGTAFALRQVMEYALSAGGRARRLYVCGGGAKSRTWSRIKASMLNMPVYVVDSASGDVPLGDALLAGQKAGLFSGVSEAAAKSVRIREVIQPDPAWSAAYDKLYPLFTEMYRHLDADLKALRACADAL